MANYKHMNLDDRMEIQKGLKEGKSFAEIGAAIGRDGSTISKEIRKIQEPDRNPVEARLLTVYSECKTS